MDTRRFYKIHISDNDVLPTLSLFFGVLVYSSFERGWSWGLWELYVSWVNAFNSCHMPNPFMEKLILGLTLQTTYLSVESCRDIIKEKSSWKEAFGHGINIEKSNRIKTTTEKKSRSL